MLFFIGTVIYGLVSQYTNSKKMLFVSLFLGSLGLFSNLSLQLQGRSCVFCSFLTKLFSITILYVAVSQSNMSIDPIVMVLAIFVILAINGKTLINRPSPVRMGVVLFSVLLLSVLYILTDIFTFINIDPEIWIFLIISPYFFLAILDLLQVPGVNEKEKLTYDVPSGKSISSYLIIIAQVIPVLSGSILVMIISHSTNKYDASQYILYERSLAVGCSVSYFSAKVFNIDYVKHYLWILGSLIIFGFVFGYFKPLNYLGAIVFFISGVYLSFATILLNIGRKEFAVFFANLIAFISLSIFFLYLNNVSLSPSQLLTLYLMPQVLFLFPFLYPIQRKNVHIS